MPQFGVAVFLLGDRIVERRFGDEGTGGAMGIVVGSVVDGVPESIIFGIQLATGFPPRFHGLRPPRRMEVVPSAFGPARSVEFGGYFLHSASFLAAVLISNVPQATAPWRTCMRRGGDLLASFACGAS